MGHARRRPIVGRTPDGVGAHYIVVESFLDDMSAQFVANGTVTYTVDSTIQNILFDSAQQAAVNATAEEDRYTAAASAIWTNEVASQVNTDSIATLTKVVFAIRIDITAGTGSVSYHIAQG